MHRFLTLTPCLLLLLPPTLAHGPHETHQQQAPHSSTTDTTPNANTWATLHMTSEHHISNFDAGSFFTLHDFNSDGVWDPAEIKRFYGLEHESNRDVGEERREEVVRRVLEVWDGDGDGVVSRGEWMEGCGEGGELDDFGLGPGHHGDDEYEYEIHHYELYHDENTREEDLTHPEDIAHFKKHEMEEDEAWRQEQLDKMTVIEANIPDKFRRRS